MIECKLCIFTDPRGDTVLTFSSGDKPFRCTYYEQDLLNCVGEAINAAAEQWLKKNNLDGHHMKGEGVKKLIEKINPRPHAS